MKIAHDVSLNTVDITGKMYGLYEALCAVGPIQHLLLAFVCLYCEVFETKWFFD